MKKVKYTVIAVLTLLILWMLYSLVSHRISQPSKAYGHTLKVMTYNTHAMMIGEKMAEKRRCCNTSTTKEQISCACKRCWCIRTHHD